MNRKKPKIVVITTGGTIAQKYDAKSEGAIRRLTGERACLQCAGIGRLGCYQNGSFFEYRQPGYVAGFVAGTCELDQRSRERTRMSGDYHHPWPPTPWKRRRIFWI